MHIVGREVESLHVEGLVKDCCQRKGGLLFSHGQDREVLEMLEILDAGKLVLVDV